MAQDDEAAVHRVQAIKANNSVWELLDSDLPDTTELLGRASAASYHWARAADRTLANVARDQGREVFESDRAAPPWFGLT